MRGEARRTKAVLCAMALATGARVTSALVNTAARRTSTMTRSFGGIMPPHHRPNAEAPHIAATARRAAPWRLFSAAPTAAGDQKKGGKGGAPPAVEQTAEELKTVRLGKVQEMQDAGINPYAYTWDVTHTSTQVREGTTNMLHAHNISSVSV